MRRGAAAAVGLAAAALLLGPAYGAAPWVDRSIVLPRGTVAVDAGLGLGHEPPPAGSAGSVTGFGANLELAVGVTRELELGVRAGFRLDDDGRATQADAYARPFDAETYGTLNDSLANPELRLRWAAARGSTAEIGLELRLYFPVETQSKFGAMFALPVLIRGGALRVDTGVYLPVVFYQTTVTMISIPVHLWIQASRTLWLGPLCGIRIVNMNGNIQEDYPLGFGVGHALQHDVDLHAWIVFPDLAGDAAARTFGAGAALELRID